MRCLGLRCVDRAASGLSSAFRRGLAQAQTRLVRLLGRTPWAPKRTVVLKYTGPKSGRVIELPVWAVEDPKRPGAWIVGVGASDVKTWWRTFRHPLPVTLTDTRGRVHDLEGVLTDGALRDEVSAAYFAQISASSTMFGPDAPFLLLTPRA